MSVNFSLTPGRGLLFTALTVGIILLVQCSSADSTPTVSGDRTLFETPALAPLPTAVPTQITTPGPSLKSRGFPTVVITGFMIECQQTGISQGNCSCAIGNLQTHYYYEDFVELGLDLGDTEYIPDHLARVLAPCDP